MRNPASRIRTLSTVLSFVIVCSLGAASGDLGQIDFPTSGSPAAQPHFLRGALLLHSFEFDDAREAFQQAQKIDPNFAMAYWGEAMSHNHPLWLEQDLPAARAALNRLGPTPEARLAKAPTERERDYFRALEVLYGEGDKKARDLAYSEAMRGMAERYPGDLDAASFYALALLGTSVEERDFRTYMRAAAIVEEVFAKNPQHPGAAHYLIHSYDDPIHAPLGLRAARVYAKIAPSAAHAQHMPSHIFVAMGMWPESVSSNEDSWASSEARVKRKNLGFEDRGYHALLWLEYSYLQQGRYRDARRQLAIMEQDARESGSELTRGHLAYMRAHYLIETRQWDTVISSPPLEGLGASQIAAGLFASGMSAVERDDLAAARQALADMKEQRQKSTARTPSRYRAAEIMEHELDALIHSAVGHTAQALDLMKQATEWEDNMSFAYGPPVPVKPSHELYGEMLLELGRLAEARDQFAQALDRAPRRALSLLGLARAAARSSDQATARQTYGELQTIWSHADRDLPEVREAERLLSQLGP